MLDTWVQDLLADPKTKQPAALEDFPRMGGYLDARVLLQNTPGFKRWKLGQSEYETYESTGAAYGDGIESYLKEIEYDRETYEEFRMSGKILDVGGGAGTVREFLPPDVNFVSVDPFVEVLASQPQAKREAYSCLQRPLNFVCGFAEFLPFQENSFDWVHMRSMLDHVQIPDLALIEARRVLKTNGKLLVGMHVEGGTSGRLTLAHRLVSGTKAALGSWAVGRWRDTHVWHPTIRVLRKMLTDNGFQIQREYWQPYWQGTVVYVEAWP